MLAAILPYMRCPRCAGRTLLSKPSGLSCTSCKVPYPWREGILDMIGECADEVITPFQHLMQASLIVSIYEKLWRRLGYYLASSRSFDEEMRTVLRCGRGRSGSRILDLACGTGIFTRRLAQQSDAVVVGLDLSWPMLRRARQLIEKEGVKNVVLIRGTAFQLPFIAAAFPYVNCCGALHLFDRPDEALREVVRILCPGGHMCVQTTIRPAHSSGMAYILERFIRFGFFKEEELRERLRLRGFSVLESERHRISYTLLARRAS